MARAPHARRDALQRGGFDADRGLYDSVLLGCPFRSVDKTFQVRVWEHLQRTWDALLSFDRARVEALPATDVGLDCDGFVVAARR